jgi:hypothetical protein
MFRIATVSRLEKLPAAYEKIRLNNVVVERERNRTAAENLQFQMDERAVIRK